MAISRKLMEVSVRFAADGTPVVIAHALITDTDEGTSTGQQKQLNAQTIQDAAVALRDAVLAKAEQVGKPLTF